MSQTKISSDRVHNFNRVTLAIDRQLQAEFEIDLLIMPEELRRNSIVAAQWHTAGDRRVCPLCSSLEGNVYPVDSPEYGRIAPPIHLNCRCILSYITSRERGVEARIEKYEPIDPDLLKKWSSKVYTDAEIREMVKAEPKLPLEIIDSKHEKEITEKLIKELPPEVREQLMLDIVKFTDEIPGHPEWQGMYYVRRREITLLKKFVNVDRASGRKTIFHELGHSLERRMSAYEMSELTRIFSAAKKAGLSKSVSQYALSGEMEFWADHFGTYMVNPNIVMQKNRQIYDLIANFLARVSRGM